MARTHGPRCIQILAEMAGLGPGAPATAEPVRLQAVNALLDRGYGRPSQMISGDKQAPLVVDFRWATSPEEATATPLLEAVVEPYNNDDDAEAVWTQEPIDNARQ